jgi:hypothetical protein
MPLAVSATSLGLTCCLILLSRGAAGEPTSLHEPRCDNVRVAIIRFEINEWLVDEWKSDPPSETHEQMETFFISVNDRDPTKEFMKCLADLPGRIRGASEEGARNYHVADSQTGKYATEFWVERVRLKSSNIAEVEAGHYCGTMCSARICFRLRRDSGQWRVTQKLWALYE